MKSENTNYSEFDVSIIIVNWNTKDLLIDCINSIYKFTEKSDFEIIVVDNGSNDGSQQIIKNIYLNEQYKNIRLICNNENFGFAKANNIGIEQSSGRYVCLVNSDILLIANTIDLLIDYMDSNPDIGAIGPQTVNKDLSIRINVREFPSLKKIFMQALFLDRIFPNTLFFRGKTMYWFDHESTRTVEVLSGCFLMVRQCVVNAVGTLDEQFFIYGEDVDWCNRIWNNGWKIVFYADTRVIHYSGISSNKVPFRFLLEMQKANLKYWQKYHNFFEQILYKLISIINYTLRLISWYIVKKMNHKKKDTANMKIEGYLMRIKYLISN